MCLHRSCTVLSRAKIFPPDSLSYNHNHREFESLLRKHARSFPKRTASPPKIPWLSSFLGLSSSRRDTSITVRHQFESPFPQPSIEFPRTPESPYRLSAPHPN